jgi:hypothetical protein
MDNWNEKYSTLFFHFVYWQKNDSAPYYINQVTIEKCFFFYIISLHQNVPIISSRVHQSERNTLSDPIKDLYLKLKLPYLTSEIWFY